MDTYPCDLGAFSLRSRCVCPVYWKHRIGPEHAGMEAGVHQGGGTVYFPVAVANDIEKLRIADAAREAPATWRFRRIRSRERKVLEAVLASITALFMRRSRHSQEPGRRCNDVL